MQRHVYQQRLLCLGRPNAQTLAIASTDNFHKLPDDKKKKFGRNFMAEPGQA